MVLLLIISSGFKYSSLSVLRSGIHTAGRYANQYIVELMLHTCPVIATLTYRYKLSSIWSLIEMSNFAPDLNSALSFHTFGQVIPSSSFLPPDPDNAQSCVSTLQPYIHVSRDVGFDDAR